MIFLSRTNFLTPRSLVHFYITRFNTDISLSQVGTNLTANFVSYKDVKMYTSLPNDSSMILRNLSELLFHIYWILSYNAVGCDFVFLYVLMYIWYYSTVCPRIVFTWFFWATYECSNTWISSAVQWWLIYCIMSLECVISFFLIYLQLCWPNIQDSSSH